MRTSRGKYLKDNPLTKARNNRRRRTVNGQRIYPSHPDYPHPKNLADTPIQCAVAIARIRAEWKKLYKRPDVEENKATDGFIYIVQNNYYPSMLKIGKSRDPERRLQSASSFVYPSDTLTLVDAFYCVDIDVAEREAHRQLFYGHIEREWFNVSVSTARSWVSAVVHTVNKGRYL